MAALEQFLSKPLRADTEQEQLYARAGNTVPVLQAATRTVSQEMAALFASLLAMQPRWAVLSSLVLGTWKPRARRAQPDYREAAAPVLEAPWPLLLVKTQVL